MIKLSLGFFLILAGIVLGLWLGLWVCFIGGIVDIVATFRAETFDAGMLAFGVLKVVGASIAGWASALLLIVPGAALVQKS